jgi:hypothetical protein
MITPPLRPVPGCTLARSTECTFLLARGLV